MTQTVKIRNLILGEGIPKICVPVMGSIKEEVLESARFALLHNPDMIEWRCDFLKNVQSVNDIGTLLKELRDILGEMPLLFTFRTKDEGGEQELSLPSYIDLCTAAIES